MLDAWLPYFSRRYGETFELIAVVNGSSDGTAAQVERYARRWPQVRLLVEPGPVGKGGAVMLGFRAATGVKVGYADADGSTPPESFDDLVRQTGPDAPVVIASRWCRGSVVHPVQPWIRRLASRMFNHLTRLLFGFRLHDTQCGAKMFDRSVIDRLLQRPGIITRWAFDVDLLFQARREGVSILEVPTVWHDVEGSKLVVTEASLEMIAALVRLRLMYSPLRWIVGVYDRLFGGDASEEALRQHLLFGLSGQLANLCNFAFQIVMAHLLLCGGAAAYGELMALLSAGLLAGAVNGGAARQVAESVKASLSAGNLRAVRSSILGCLRGLVLLLPFLLAGVLFADEIASGFKLASVQPVYLVLMLAAGHACLSVLNGALSGLQARRSTARLNAVHSMLRLGMASVLVMAGLGVTGALAGTLVGVLVTLLAAVILVYRLLPVVQPDEGCQPAVGRSGRGLTLMAVGFAILSGADFLLARWRFTPSTAGEYALAAMFARVVFFLPMPFAAAAFPRIMAGGRAGDRGRPCRDFQEAWLVLCVSLGLPAAFIMLFPGMIIRMLTAADPAMVAPLLRMLVPACLPIPMLALLLNHEFVHPRGLRVALLPLLSAAGYILAVMFVVNTPMGLATAMGVANVLCLAALLPRWPVAGAVRRKSQGRCLRQWANAFGVFRFRAEATPKPR